MRRGPSPRDHISTEWTPELAYIVGLIATDGCLYNDGRHISFTSADFQLVQLFKRELNLSNKIGYKYSKISSKACPHIQFGSVIFYEWLLDLGLTPHKSRTIGSLNIPVDYFFDFIRGCFDGDGTVYSYKDPRWKNSYMFYVSFASASTSFVQWLQSELQRLAYINGHITPVQKNTYQLRYAKAESLVLISKMYYDRRVPCLERKRVKVASILNEHRKNQRENPRVFIKDHFEIKI